MNPIYRFQNETGAFICFNRFPNEEDLSDFLTYLQNGLNIQLDQPRTGPYSTTCQFAYKGVSVVAMYDQNTGCCLRVEKEDMGLLDTLLQQLGEGVGPANNE